MTRREVLEKIAQCEKARDFHNHVDPVDFSMSLPVTEDFHYIKKGIKEKLKIFFQNLFVVKPYTLYQNKVVTKTKVIGRKNLRGIKSAIVTCNHVYMFDCLVAKYGLRGHKLFITGAEFNNRKGFLGEMMRAGGLLPLSSQFSVMKKFNQAIEHYLNTNNYILFYPEEAMWYMYEKPRPLRAGAFRYASKYNVPVIPMFITYRPSNKKDGEGLDIKYFTLNIMKPLYPDPELSDKDNAEILMAQNYELWKQKYEENYNKKLSYDQ